MRHYRVIVTLDDLSSFSQVITGASFWHAIDKAYSKYFDKQPDRKKYRAINLNSGSYPF